MDRSGRRVTYDRFWGLVLLVTCFLPARLEGDARLWNLVAAEENAAVIVWLLLAAAAGVFGVTANFFGWKGRPRHLTNFVLGIAMLAGPLVTPVIWQRFPFVNPVSLPLGDAAEIGWVVLVALAAIYTGSGMRIVRPSHIAGPALGALGALLVAVFAFLPRVGGEPSYGMAQLGALSEIGARWRALLPFLLTSAGVVCAILNLIRTGAEVMLAKLTRVLLIGGLLVWIALPFLEGGGKLAAHVPKAWGALRLLAPLFLSLDGATAFIAISMTRSSE
ncbi:MAG: hypothetical protein OER88_08040 [Planctomycetota bacterium]|nr:hypothetical protein [Planctomycetota bacterium]